MKRLVPNVIHGLLIFLLGVLPLWSGGYGAVDFWLAFRATFYILVGVVVALGVNEFLIHTSDIDWEHNHGKWKVVLPFFVTFVGVNIFGPDDAGKRAAMSVGSGLMVLTALRWQANTDVLLRVGVLLALVFSAWGVAGPAFWLTLPIIALLALAFAYEPPESRTYITLHDHGRFIGAILAMGAALIVVFLIFGGLLQLLGVELNPPVPSGTDSITREPYERENKISWFQVVLLAVALYFGVPYLVRMLSEKEKGEAVDMDSIPSQPRKIAEQFKRILGRQTPRERIIYSYHEMLKGVVRLGYVHNPAHTPERIGRELHDNRGIDPRLLLAINRAFYLACYTSKEISADLAKQVEGQTEQVVDAYRET
ncbi:MAG: hypothetical protein ACQKBV_09705 [Puniceicoccales bacterium]